MRRIIRERLRREHGAVAIIVAVCMTALIAATAFTVDIGALYSERTQLQNGADAAALAIAQDCAGGACGDPNATALAMASRNANDGASNAAVDFPSANSVHVKASSLDDSGVGTFSLFFGPVLGVESKTVAADATAAWGSPFSGTAMLPLTFSKCVFPDPPTGAVQLIQIHSDHDSTDCPNTRNPSGGTLPGGFNWLAPSTGGCEVFATVTLDPSDTRFRLLGSPGVSAPNCLSDAILNQTVLLPVYDDSGGTGSSAWYAIEGWAAFKVLGWNFPSNSHPYSGTPTCRTSCVGLVGQFLNFVSLADGFTLGGPDLGASVATLSK